MKLSDRIQNIVQGGSDGWEVFIRARKMIAAGEDVLELTIGEHDIKTDPLILDAMDASARAGNTGYALVPGNQRLRQTIAERVEKQSGVPTTMDNVLVTTGGQAALFATHMAVLDPGDTGLYCDPYYATYPGCIRAVGAKDIAIPTRSKNDFQPVAAEIDAVAKDARSLLINSPNNPTGVVYSRQTIQDIADVCVRHDLWLISDEVYDTQIWRGEHISPRSLPNMKERTLVIGSMSKSHAMTGFRCGWIIAPEPVITRITDLLTVNTYGVAGFIQDAAYFALTQGDAIENEVGEVFRRRRVLAQEALQGANAIRLIPSSGAMYLMLDIRATGLSGQEFANQLLDEERIAVMPGESFGASAAGHIRVAMTLEDNRFIEALHRLIGFAGRNAA